MSDLSQEEKDQQRERLQARISFLSQQLKAGRCLFCHALIKWREQIGREVYAQPCGHRLYQGKL